MLEALALVAGLNLPNTDRFVQQGLIKPDAQVMQLGGNYDGVSASVLASKDMKFYGGTASYMFSFPGEIRLSTRLGYFRPNLSAAFGAGKTVHEFSSFDPAKIDLSVEADTSRYVDAKLNVSLQALRHWFGTQLEISSQPGEQKEFVVVGYAHRPLNWFEFGANFGVQASGTRQSLLERTEAMAYIGIDPVTKLKVELGGRLREGQPTIYAQLGWNSGGRFDRRKLETNKAMDRITQQKEKIEKQNEKISKLRAENERLKKTNAQKAEEAAQQAEEQSDEDLEHAVASARSYVRSKWTGYNRNASDDVIVEACKNWRKVYQLDSDEENLQKFLDKTSASRLKKANHEFYQGVDSYTTNKPDGALKSWMAAYGLITGSVRPDETDPVLADENNYDGYEKLKEQCIKSMKRLMERQKHIDEIIQSTPKIGPMGVTTTAAPTSTTQTSRQK